MVCDRNDRAEYGKCLLKNLSEELTREFGKGFTERNLRNMRQFYQLFPIRHTLCTQLSWSHYRVLMRINKSKVADEINQLEPKPEYEKIIKEPYVLGFLDLEQAIIDHLQKFLLELGRGFCFEGRQKYLIFDNEHFYIDLIFYNYILKCHVLFDLKIGKLTHQDLGQMQMYVNYYTRELMNEGDNPPIGIVLFADKSNSVVKYTLPEDNTQIFASKYMTYLPTEEELKKALNFDDYIKLENSDLQE